MHPEYQALVEMLPAGVAPPTVRPTNYARSTFHFISAAVALTTVALVPSRFVVTLIALAFATYAWSMEIGRRTIPGMNARLMRLYGPVAHPHEHYSVNSATWYTTALVFLALFTTRHASMASLAVLGVADPIAALIGRRWGRHPLRAGRSLEGTLAFFASGSLAAAVALLLAGGLPIRSLVAFSLLAGLAGAAAELATARIDDNLTIPVTVGAVLTVAAAVLG